MTTIFDEIGLVAGLGFLCIIILGIGLAQFINIARKKDGPTLAGRWPR